MLLKVSLPALLLGLSVYLTAALELDAFKAVEFLVICVVCAWSLGNMKCFFSFSRACLDMYLHRHW